MLSLSFNQSFSCLIVGRSSGFLIFNCFPFSKCFDSANNESTAIQTGNRIVNETANPNGNPLISASPSNSPIGGVYLCEMLFNTSLVALVGSGDSSSDSPRKLRLFNTRTEKSICEVNFVSSILSLRLTLSRLVTVHTAKIHIFDLKTMKILHSLETPPNPRGIIAINYNPNGSNYLVFPASETTGELIIYDASNLQIVNSIRAHNTRCRCLAFNRNGNLLATASDQGTVMRVFSIPDGQKLYTFRRGTMSALVNSIAFNSNSSLIALSSENSSTVHVFSLIHDENQQKEKKPDSETSSGFSSLLNLGSDSFSFSQLGSALISSGQQLAASAVSVIGSVSHQFSQSQYAKSLPPSLIDLVEPRRHWASVILKDSAHPRSVAFDSNLPNRLLIVSNEGYLYTYNIPSHGGHCRLESEFSLLEKPSEAIGAKIHQQTNSNNSINQKPPGIHPAVASQLIASAQLRASSASQAAASPIKSQNVYVSPLHENKYNETQFERKAEEVKPVPAPAQQPIRVQSPIMVQSDPIPPQQSQQPLSNSIPSIPQASVPTSGLFDFPSAQPNLMQADDEIQPENDFIPESLNDNEPAEFGFFTNEPESPPIADSPAFPPTIPSDDLASSTAIANFTQLQSYDANEVKQPAFTTTLFDLEALETPLIWNETQSDENQQQEHEHENATEFEQNQHEMMRERNQNQTQIQPTDEETLSSFNDPAGTAGNDELKESRSSDSGDASANASASASLSGILNFSHKSSSSGDELPSSSPDTTNSEFEAVKPKNKKKKKKTK